MSEIDVRDLQCENCAKFSHCNNNDLVCISKFQQLKAENEKFKNFVAHNLFDVNCDNWLDRFIDYFEKWKHELVAENEELRSDNSMLLAQGDADAFVISNLNFKIQELQKSIDEIEEMCKLSLHCDNCYEILQKIEQQRKVNNGRNKI